MQSFSAVEEFEFHILRPSRISTLFLLVLAILLFVPLTGLRK